MFDQTVSDLLTARALIAEPHLWTRHRNYIEMVDGTVMRCPGQALVDAARGNLARANRAWQYVLDAIGTAYGCDLPAWNDDSRRTHAEVLDAFDRAIAHAKRDAERPHWGALTRMRPAPAYTAVWAPSAPFGATGFKIIAGRGYTGATAPTYVVIDELVPA